MHILVTGANGELGNAMRVAADNSADHYVFTDVTQVPGVDTIFLDVTDRDAVCLLLRDMRIDAVVNCAAPGAPAFLADLLRERGGLLVQPVCETLSGVQAIRDSGCKHVVLHTSWLYGEFGQNFCRHIMQLVASESDLSMPTDLTGSPTYALDLAKAIRQVLLDYGRERTSPAYSHSGTYAYTNEGVCSLYDFARAVAEYSGSACTIHPAHSRECPHAPLLPAHAVPDNTAFRHTFGRYIPHWTEALRFCVRNMTDEFIG